MNQQLKGVEVLIERYAKAGIRDVTYDFYTGGRHEMLNETNRSEVLQRLRGWITSVLRRQNS